MALLKSSALLSSTAELIKSIRTLSIKILAFSLYFSALSNLIDFLNNETAYGQSSKWYKRRTSNNKDVDYNKVQFVNNFLIYPEFLSIVNLDIETKDNFKKNVEELIEERTWGVYSDGDGCLTNEQTNQLQGLIEHMYKNTYDKKQTNIHRKDFVAFVNEYDRRRGTNFENTFKELNNYYRLCQKKVYRIQQK